MAAAQCSVDAAVVMDVLRLFCYIFAHKFLFNSHFDLEPDNIRKGNSTQNSTVYSAHGNTANFSHTSRLLISM